MACEPCKKKRMKKTTITEATPYIKCYCGLNRIIEEPLEVGKVITLPTCPKCGTDFTARVNQDGNLDEITSFGENYGH